MFRTVYCDNLWQFRTFLCGMVLIAHQLSPSEASWWVTIQDITMKHGGFLTLEAWVNPSKRGGMDGVFQGISRGRSPRKIPRSSPASPRQTPHIKTLHIKDVTKTIKVLCQLIYIWLPNFEMAVLKDDSIEVPYIGSYRMPPDRSSCLGLSANGLIVWQIHQDSCLAFCKTRNPYGPT